MDIGTRIRNRRLELGMSATDLAKKIGRNRATIYRYENGEIEKMPFAVLFPIARALQCEVSYLVGVKGSTVGSDALPEALAMEMTDVPMLGEISCGTPITVNEESEKMQMFNDGTKADFALRCKGDSMINARICDGDIVFIQATPIVDNGTIAAVLVNDEVTLKRVYQSTNEIRLVAENPIYPTMTYFGEELDHVKILGRVVAFQAKI